MLLLHGATVPGWEFDRLVPYLNAAGYRVLCPDFFGHGYSDRPRRRYNYDLFARQLLELLDELAVYRPFGIIGHSMGATIGARLACALPTRVQRLVLLAPLFDYRAVNPSIRWLAIPGLGELLMPLSVFPGLTRRRRLRFASIDDEQLVEKLENQLAIPGFSRALLSMVRNGVFANQTAAYQELATRGHPTLVLRGTADTLFQQPQYEALLQLLPAAIGRQLPDLEHPLMLTHPEDVAAQILPFLRE